MHVLALNSGSSSLKFGLYRVDAGTTTVLLEGNADAIGSAEAAITAHDAGGAERLHQRLPLPTQREAVERIGALLSASGLPAPEAIGHRIVHGGPALRRHCRIDATVVEQLSAAGAFAPLHTPPALAVVRYAMAHFPGIPQVACFDTAFHARLDEVARVLPLPRALRAEGIERYGFHGLSCESIVAQLGSTRPPRVVIAHLGNGASITAVRDGRSIDTSMGLTPTGGVVMGTRSGDLDPGVLLYLMREKHLDAAALEDLVDRQSGLAGISGAGHDMRRLKALAATDADARLAIAMFCRAIAREIAGMVVSLEGIDLLVFTGGIGENDADARATICAQLRAIGIHVDADRNVSAVGALQAPDSRCAIRVLPSLEDARIARHAFDLLS